jgi:hypothetical protein
MTKKVLIVLGIIAVAVVLYLAFGKQFRPSPPARTELTNGDLSIVISYSQPSVRGRTIFGSGEQALQPYGKYWRLGANEATEISFNKNVDFAGKPLDAGTYSMYAIPGPESFTIVLNSETDKSGAPEPDHNLDVLEVDVPVQETDAPVEKFTITLQPLGEAINIIFEWAHIRLVVPITERR